MARTPTTSLWSMIQGMQERLEAAGLERRVVDAAVQTGLEALLEVHPPRRSKGGRPVPAWLVPHLRTA